MTKIFIKNICVVCLANYCRSPVAEVLLKEKFQNQLNISSCGLSPLISAGMDPRSKKFLSDLKIESGIHTPKKINQKIINTCDLILALDPLILFELNQKFPGSMAKFKVLSYQCPGLDLSDPYHYDDEGYKKIMDNIFTVCDQMSFD